MATKMFILFRLDLFVFSGKLSFKPFLYFMFLLHFKKKDTQRMTLTTIKVEIDLVYLTLFSSQKLNTEL